MSNSAAGATGNTLPSRPRRFFAGMALAMLLTVFCGFASTYYLKGNFNTPDLDWQRHVHGLALTLWYVLFVVQTLLINYRQTALHRTLGIAGFLLAIAILPLSASVNPNTLILTSGFLLLVSSAAYFRKQPETHKRLMLLASISLLGPAISRLLGQLVAGGIVPSTIFMPFAFTDLVFPFLLALVIFDLMSDRKLHPATLLGGIFVIGIRKAFFMFAPFG